MMAIVLTSCARTACTVADHVASNATTAAPVFIPHLSNYLRQPCNLAAALASTRAKAEQRFSLLDTTDQRFAVQGGPRQRRLYTMIPGGHYCSRALDPRLT